MSNRPTALLTLNADLSRANTLGLPVRAARVFEITDSEQLPTICREVAGRDEAMHFIGGGSNIICAPDISGTVCLMRTRGIRQLADGTLVEVAAGENWHDLVRFCVAQGLVGIEQMALVPGSVGAAPVQNIGAYGAQLSDVLVSVSVYDRWQDETRQWRAQECELGYRDSIFRRDANQRYIILSITLRLRRADDSTTVEHYPDVAQELARMGLRGVTARERFEAVVRVRRRKLPDYRAHPNVGSMFKNPRVTLQEAQRLSNVVSDLRQFVDGAGHCKLAAAQLLDHCGLKGRTDQGVLVWPRQPLVLVNVGATNGTQFLAVVDALAAHVYRELGVQLEREPVLLGFR